MTKTKATPSQLWLEHIYDSNLSSSQKAVAAFLASRIYGHKKSCFPSATTIAEKTGFSTRRTRDHLNALIAQKWIESNSVNRAGSRILTIRTPDTMSPPDTVSPDTMSPLTPCHPPPDTVSPESVTESVKTIYTFKPPSVEDVRDYCDEKGYSVDPDTFVDWNASKGWMIGKNKMKDWKAAVRTWERRNKTDGQTRSSGKSHSQRGPKVTNLSELFNTGNVIDG